MPFLYINNNDQVRSSPTNTVSALEIKPSGALTPVPGSPFSTGGTGTAGIIDGTNTIAHSQSRCLFASNQDDNTVSAFEIKPNGVLRPVTGSPFASGLDLSSTGSLAVTTGLEENFLYVGGSNGIGGFRIGGNCALQPIGSASTGRLVADPPFAVCDLLVTPGDRFLVASIWGVKELRVFGIGSNGSLTAVSGSPFPGDSQEQGGLEFLLLSRRGGLLFVGHRFWTWPHPTSGMLVSVYRMGLGAGGLAPVSSSPFQFDSGWGSSYLRLSPDGRFLFVGNNLSRTVTILQVSRSTGKLTLVTGSPFDVATGNRNNVTLSGMERDDAGGSLFIANTKIDVTAFKVTSGPGLSPAGGSPFATGNTNVVTLQSGIVFVQP